MADAQLIPPGVDTTVPSPARLYDYYLGGSNNFEADREAAERIRTRMPELSDAAWANRGFHQRAARWLAAEVGIRQFIDIGSGLPTVGNTHDVVRQVNPRIRVVYVDSDPMVELHSRVLLDEQTRVNVACADLRDPDSVLGHPAVGSLIDFSQPTALLMTAVLHFVSPASKPYELVSRYMEALPPGSYLALSHITDDLIPQSIIAAIHEVYAHATEQMYFRSKPDVERFFAGLDLVPPRRVDRPAVVHAGAWGAEDLEQADSEGSRILWAGVAKRS
jgi:O-methyltransferase involved in polyketide biosynthesis